jgi:hypothetical protein
VAQLLGGRADATGHPAGGFIVGLTLPMAE